MLIKTIHILLCFFFALLAAIPVSGQQNTPPLFKGGEKISFIGNSITHSGGFHNHVLLYYATRFPNEEITFLNAGISGDNANDILRRLDDDIIPQQADWSIVMVGMNDVNRALYAPKRVGEEGLEKEKQKALENFRNHLDKMLRKLSQTGTKIILQTPSIYDQTAQSTSENHIGVNDALKECTAIVEEMAIKYNTYLVDYWRFMTETNERLQQNDPTATIISIDRVHPWGTGDLIMAYRFLKETETPQTVAEVEIEKGIVNQCINCTAKIVKANNLTMTFQVHAKSLPFPLEDEPQTALALELVPFMEQLNREVLRLTKLKQGTYSLSIDEIFVGEFTNQELAEGINLALFRNTPQYQQALKVRDIAVAYRKMQRQLRDIKMIQNRHLPAGIRSASISEIESFISGTLDSLKNTNDKKFAEMQKKFENYLVLKGREKEMEEKLVELAASIYKNNKPVAHNYELQRSSKNNSQKSIY